MSITQIHKKTGVALSTIRYALKKAGALRTRAQALQIASSDGRLGSGLRGKKRVFTQEWKENISIAKSLRGDFCARGVSLKPSGYLEHTRGENKGRSVHVVAMEGVIGRRLFANEVVHHRDGDRSNNDLKNLELMTRAKHASLHAKENVTKRKRNSSGKFK